jgi:rod shape-determining protein MreD
MGQRRLIEAGKIALIVIIAVVLQTVVISHISVLGVGADLFLIFTVIMAINRGPAGGAVFGFFAGLAADIAYLQPLGVRALVYVVTGYYLGMLVGRLGQVNLWVLFLLAAGSSLIAQFVFGVFEYVMGPREGLLTMMGRQMAPEAVLDALLTVPIYVMLVHLRLISLPRPEPAPGGSATE